MNDFLKKWYESVSASLEATIEHLKDCNGSILVESVKANIQRHSIKEWKFHRYGAKKLPITVIIL